MKRFCSQCGKELERNILICPKCGFKNKKKRNKKKLIIPLIVLLILVILGGTGYLFKDQLISFIGNPLDIITQLQDPDYEKKMEFKETYEKYLLEINSFNESRGYPIDDKNSEKLNVKDLYNQRLDLLKQIKEDSCYTKFNSNRECDTLREKIIGINNDIRKILVENTSEFTSCCTGYEPFPEMCKELPICGLNTYRAECSTCDDLLYSLLSSASKPSDPSLAENLILLTTALQEYNKISIQLMWDIRELEYYDILLNKNRAESKIAEAKSEKEIKQVYDNYDESSRYLFFSNGTITKEKLLNKYEQSNTNLIEGRRNQFTKFGDSQTTSTAIKDDIKGFVSILNGAYGLELSLPN